MESKSLYIQQNNSNSIHLDDYGRPMNEVRVDAEAFEKRNQKIILRFRNGLLDGDIYVDGKYVRTKPAVDAPGGHLEYWREGKLHRDGGLAAVISDGFQYKEYWINGIRQS